jgi:hypothetical protein
MLKLLFQCLCPKTNFGPTITDELDLAIRASTGGHTRWSVSCGVRHFANPRVRLGCRSRSSLYLS